MYLLDLADACRKSGLTVVETAAWRNRGHGPLVSVDSIVCHHTAGPASGNMPSLNVITHGRAGLSGPLANLGLGRDGTVYVVASGLAYHAGVVARTAYTNSHAIGIEAEATGVTSWPDAQMDAYARLCAALCDHYRLDVSDVVGHKEAATPRGRKIDPNFDMDAFRARIRSANKPKDWFDMATEKDLKDAVRAELKASIGDIAQAVLAANVEQTDVDGGKPRKMPLRQLLDWNDRRQQRIEKKLNDLLAALEAAGK